MLSFDSYARRGASKESYLDAELFPRHSATCGVSNYDDRQFGRLRLLSLSYYSRPSYSTRVPWKSRQICVEEVRLPLAGKECPLIVVGLPGPGATTTTTEKRMEVAVSECVEEAQREVLRRKPRILIFGFGASVTGC